MHHPPVAPRTPTIIGVPLPSDSTRLQFEWTDGGRTLVLATGGSELARIDVARAPITRIMRMVAMARRVHAQGVL